MQLQRLSTYLILFNEKVTLNSISPEGLGDPAHIALCDQLIRIFAHVLSLLNNSELLINFSLSFR